MIKKIFFIVFLILVIIPGIYAGNYGSGTYGTGEYSVGEEPVTPSSEGSSSGGDSSGGGGGGAIASEPEIEVEPTEIDVRLAVNTNREYTIQVTNPSNTKKTIQISQHNLDEMVILSETTLELEPKETKELRVIFVSLNETGIFTGKILIGNKEILVSLSIKTKLLLFDSNIIVLNKDYIIEQGDKLKTKVVLIPQGDKERLDVTLNYIIKDYDGKIYSNKTETLLVEEQIDFERDLDTGMLPVGEYAVSLELIYPGGVAPSSAHFKVIEKEKKSLFSHLKEIPSKIWIITGAVGLFIVILVGLVYLIKQKKKKR